MRRAQRMKIVFFSSLLGLGVLVTILSFAKPTMFMNAEEQRLLEAVAQDDLATIRNLVKQGINVNAQDARGRTALLVAVEGHYFESAKVLLKAGADVNVQDDKKDSPLLLAGAEGTVDIMRLILQAKPDFSLYNRFGGTPLIPAAERGHVDMVKLLVNTKVDINHVNHLGWTALLEAIVLSDGGPRHQKIVQILVDAGADVHIADNQGVTPLEHARQKGFSEIVKVLESAGVQ
ncbi:ankyrin repeat domain-containing protein [Candidatus Nitronereus thalassa]|uniref:Ankyrin repeat domain-containing protein n=1 Tax=Candidatus Nitronereus thalassa TaxID=3020898 RepID=A0ABU3K6Y9_9BACT|nr:ankyrin repeat domain-containing protein [Candidatus Nitronereus thalassa]MDT7042205.1 ankyrin repeat domain-containing protein [Candidatus Nitronereus thalassa]